MDILSPATLEEIESNIGVHCFTTTVAEKVIKFEVYKFKDSIYIYLGYKHLRNFFDLALAMSTESSPEPIATKIRGRSSGLSSNNLALKLCKKLNKPVYVSFNLAEDRMTVPIVTERIVEEIQNHPEFF